MSDLKTDSVALAQLKLHRGILRIFTGSAKLLILCLVVAARCYGVILKETCLSRQTSVFCVFKLPSGTLNTPSAFFDIARCGPNNAPGVQEEVLPP
jgi:hypothetical protein